MADTQLSDYRIERVTRKSLEDLVPLYKAAFKKKYSIEYLQKKFDTACFDAEYIGYIAYFGNKAAAFYTVFPCIMEYKGQAVLAAQSGDTMTHPEHRGKGLFIYLANKTYELARESGIRFMFGFPNNNSYKGAKETLQWRIEDNMNLYKTRINTIPLATIGAKSPAFNFFYKCFLHFILLFYKRVKKPFHAIPDEERIHVKYNADYFNYKSYGGSFMLNIAGVDVWMKINGSLLIGDMGQIQDENTGRVLQRLKRFAFLIGCRYIVYSFSKGMFWDKQLSGYIVPENGLPVAYYDFNSGLPLSKLVFSFSVLDTF